MVHTRLRPPAALLLLLLLAAFACTSARLLTAKRDVIRGKVIVVNQDWGEGLSSTMVVVETPKGRRVPVRTVIPGLLDRFAPGRSILTGTTIELEGRWEDRTNMKRMVDLNDDAEPDVFRKEGDMDENQSETVYAADAAALAAGTNTPATAAAKAAAANDSLWFEVSAVKSCTGGPPPSEVGVLASAAAAAAAKPTTGRVLKAVATVPAGWINMTQGAGKWVTRQLMSNNMSVLVVPLAAKTASGAYCAGLTAPPLTKASIRRVMFAEVNTGDPANTVGGTFNMCSHNKTLLTAANSLVTDPVTLGCNGSSAGVLWSMGTCDWDDIVGYADAADALLRGQGINLSLYQRKLYLLPSHCKFVGLAYVGCDGTNPCRAWMGGGYWGSSQAIAHELGHTLWMGHAGKVTLSQVFDEYGDDTCTMGYCCDVRCWHAPHAFQQGWDAARQFDDTNLLKGQTANTTLFSQSLLASTNGAAQTGARVQPTLAWGNTATTTLPTIYFSFRTAARGDAYLWPELASAVHIHTSSAVSRYDDAITAWEAQLAVGGSWTYSPLGLVVRRYNSTSANQAVISLCRRGGAETATTCRSRIDNDCNGKAGADDSACVAAGWA